VEYASETVADAFGLNDSQYQWVIDEHMKQKELVPNPKPESRKHCFSVVPALNPTIQGYLAHKKPPPPRTLQ